MDKYFTSNAQKEELNKILKVLTDKLDITNTQREDAISKYNAIATYLGNDPLIHELNPEIYPQGSFSLGTVIKPLSDADEYDIDLVCELKDGSPSKLTQEELKNLIGNRLKGDLYKDKLKDKNGSRRCWTIEYAEDTQLHLDILPAFPDSESRKYFSDLDINYGETAINITDNEHPFFYVLNDDWVKSNPKGYQKWFKESMLIMLNESKKTFAAEYKTKIDDVPDYKVKTPLQRAIQLLKRHRDSTCIDNDDKPISIIITTLAAKAYKNEDNLYDAITKILDGMADHIRFEYKDGKKVTVISNPVDNRENFADKWELHPIRELIFMKWMQNANSYFKNLLKDENDLQWVNESLNKGFGKNIVKRTFTELGNQNKHLREQGNLRMLTGTGTLVNNLDLNESKKVKKHNFYGNDGQ